jgi:hypothetical protein
MMKQIMMGAFLLCTLASSAFAIGGAGYVWISTIGSLTYDDINYGNSRVAHVLTVDPKKGLPNINSIIVIEPRNRFFIDFNLIQNISNEFISLVKEGKCDKMKGTFSNFMLNETKECSVDSVIEQIIDQYPKDEVLYFDELKYPIKAKVLGYVEFRAGVFVFVQVMEVIKEEKKDK